ncbi:MAG: hypothetical protein IJW62_07900 [Clostridia bacterium]|nr:hypothetical protein [Clostridia bacterium]
MRSDLKKILEQLSDPNNDEPIELENDRGEIARFSQMALIPVTTPSEEYEDEMVDHNFALLQPLDENGEEDGDQVVFDFELSEDGEVQVTLVDNPYVLRSVITLYRQRGRIAEEEPEEAEVAECDSIFGGTLFGEPEVEDDRAEAEEEAAQLEEELIENITPEKEVKKEKKSFFGKLFGKK